MISKNTSQRSKFYHPKSILRENSAKNKIEPIWTEIYPARVSVMGELFEIADTANISLENALSDDWFPD